MKHFAAAIAIICWSVGAAAQTADSLRARGVLEAGLSINLHRADFTELPGYPNCCPEFSRGVGFGAIFGLGYEWPIGTNTLFGVRASYVNHSAVLSDRESIALSVNGVLTDGIDEHTIDASLASVGIEPNLSYRFAPRWFVTGGMRVAAMVSHSFTQQEEIVEPAATGTFLNPDGTDSHARIRNAQGGELPDANTLLAQLFGGITYEAPLNARGTLLLAPSLSYAFSLTNVVRGLTWLPDDIRLTLALKYSPIPQREPPRIRDTMYLRDTVSHSVPWNDQGRVALEKTSTTQEAIPGDTIHDRTYVHESYRHDVPAHSTLECSVSAVGLDTTGAEQSKASLRVEEFLETNTHPLLGYIFFDENSSTIPSRYAYRNTAQADAFRPEQLFGEDALTINHHVLDIIGSNLRRTPRATITLEGCNANSGDEQGNIALSRARAEAVKEYLQTVWKIAPSRIAIEARNLPAQPSNVKTVAGAEENRRVEITSSTPGIVDVFVASDTTRIVTPQALRFKPHVVSSGPVTGWELQASQREQVCAKYGGTAMPPDSVDWHVANEPRHIPKYDMPLHVVLRATAADGNHTECSTDIPLDVVTIQKKKIERSGDHKIERYNLVLFNSGKSTITPAQERIVAMIRKNIVPESEITIEGYTDRTGNPEANAKLATLRANATRAALGRPDALSNGVGDKRLLYPNDTPEGRFLCRTVQVVVKTPVGN